MDSPPSTTDGASLVEEDQGGVLKSSSRSGQGDDNRSEGGGNTPSVPDLHKLNGVGLLMLKGQSIRPKEIECGVCNKTFLDSNLRCPNCGAWII